MIKQLYVSNFKSVRKLDIECKKVNLFIGEPNTGKSNILEALALLSWCGQSGQEPLSNYVRFELMQYLFYDGLVADQSVEIRISTKEIDPTGICVTFNTDHYEIRKWEENRTFRKVDNRGHYRGSTVFGHTRDIKFFRFKNLAKYDDKEPVALKPPSGKNLFSVVFGSEILRETMKEFFLKYGLRLVLKPQEKIFELQKQTDDLVFSVPYVLSSDTLRRIIFYTVAIASNKDSVLVFEEPESNAFPYYTKYLGERIALDQTNQFFIATHNPYLLSAIIEKSRREDVQVFITYFDDFQTRVKPLTVNQLSELMEADPFLSIDRFIEEE
ncbi:MAG: AAA family ATPase [Sedimentisphaerales bacterium]|nr:AAA family ATPase [Sedimentisphaerales bacterium]